MKIDSKPRVCGICGYTANGRFVGDICPKCGLTYWRCANCGYTFSAKMAPDACSKCGEACSFKDVTCYTPECGGPQNIDPRL
jgi:rubrerythrin